MDLDIKFTGGKELERALKRLPVQVEKKVVRQALRAGAKVWQKELKQSLPRSNITERTINGQTVSVKHLADSIAIARPRSRRRDAFIAVGVKGLARLYAHIVEFGNSEQAAQPVWRPVFRRMAGQVITTVAEKLGKDIIKEVRRGN